MSLGVRELNELHCSYCWLLYKLHLLKYNNITIKQMMLSSTQFSVRSHHFRHALLEAQVDHFISNDTISGPGGNNSRVMLITGPNACGKSIYLKQVRYICGTITRTFTRMFEFSLFTEEMFDVLPKRLWLMSFKSFQMDDCGITNCLAYL